MRRLYMRMPFPDEGEEGGGRRRVAAYPCDTPTGECWGAATYPCDTPTSQEERNAMRRRESPEGILDLPLDLPRANATGCIDNKQNLNKHRKENKT